MSTKPVHIICGKCGSDEVKFKIGTPMYMEGEGWDNNVYLVCPNWSGLTSPEEIHQWVE